MERDFTHEEGLGGLVCTKPKGEAWSVQGGVMELDVSPILQVQLDGQVQGQLAEYNNDNDEKM